MYDQEYKSLAIRSFFNVMRILKRINPGDQWYEAYMGHYLKRQETFVDTYTVMWDIGMKYNPRNILEIGCRSGISICQLLCACMDYEDKRIVLNDIFSDGYISPEIVKMNMRYLNLPAEKVEFLEGRSDHEIPKFEERNPNFKFDYILVDGDHSFDAAKKDLNMVKGLVDDGGFIIFDDIAPDGCNLIGVWEDFKKENEDSFDFFQDMNGKGVGVARKI